MTGWCIYPTQSCTSVLVVSWMFHSKCSGALADDATQRYTSFGHPVLVQSACQQLLHQIVGMQGRKGGRKGESQAGKGGSTQGEGGRFWQTL